MPANRGHGPLPQITLAGISSSLAEIDNPGLRLQLNTELRINDRLNMFRQVLNLSAGGRTVIHENESVLS